ncbi:MAG: putative polymerase sigma factor [Dehalococcoidia bacterium]|nr:putative polymerase sigma factor [Dehalococcoidia bacterium]
MISKAVLESTWPAIDWPAMVRAFILFRSQNEDLARKQSAVERLFETHFERVARYIAIRIGNIHDGEDLASEVFVRALKTVDSYKETGAPMEAWVFRIAHNITIDYLRQKGRRPAVPLDESLPLAAKDDPSEDAERKQEVEELNRAVEQLSEAQQQVLALRFGSEMTSEAAAEVMRKKPGAVREMQSAAIKKLRELLKA